MKNALTKNIVPLLAGPLVFFLTYFFFKPVGLSEQGVAVLAATLWMAIWWIFEAIPISVTALLPLVLFPLTMALDLNETAASYGHRFIFLYMGGFILAIAIEKWGLHKRIALNIISIIGSSVPRIMMGFMIATAFMSMWISNTATSVMMLPIAIAIILQLKENPNVVESDESSFAKGLMLAIAYSASIGGMASLIGTPPNLVFAGIINELYGVEISFAQWFMFGFPISCILLTVAWIYLTRFAFNISISEFPGGKAEIHRLKRELGPISRQELLVLTVFVCTALLWIFRSFLQNYLPALDDPIIAIIASIALFVIPSGDGKGDGKGDKKDKALISWEEAVRLPWGIILLFGGGMAIAGAFQSSGLAIWIGSGLSAMNGMHLLLVIAVIITSVNFLTEITSNLATTAMLLPILGALAVSLDVHPYVIMVAATVSASCAFMLPIATPPNAIVFGSGYLTIKDMFTKGFIMNVIAIFVLTLFVYYGLELIWGFDPNIFPQEFKTPSS